MKKLFYFKREYGEALRKMSDREAGQAIKTIIAFFGNDGKLSSTDAKVQEELTKLKPNLLRAKAGLQTHSPSKKQAKHKKKN